MAKARYKDIVSDLMEAIETGEFNPGDRIWSSREIENRYKVSQLTALRVFKELAVVGRIERRDGTGYYVTGAESLTVKNMVVAAFRPLRRITGMDNDTNRMISGIAEGCFQYNLGLYTPPAANTLRGRIPTLEEAKRMADEIADIERPLGVILDMRYTDEMIEKYLLPACGNARVVILGRRSRLKKIATVAPPFEQSGRDAAWVALKDRSDKYILLHGKSLYWRMPMLTSFRDGLLHGGVPESSIEFREDDLTIREEIIETCADEAELFRKEGKKITFFSYSDYLAREFCNELAERKLEPSKDYNLISCGNLESCLMSKPYISSIDLDPCNLGSLAIEALCVKSDWCKDYSGNFRINFRETF